MAQLAKKVASKNARRLTAREAGGLPSARVPSAEGVRYAFSTLTLPTDASREVGKRKRRRSRKV